MNMAKWVFVAALAVSLCSCTGEEGAGVQVVSQSATPYPPVPVAHVNVSSHPPKGTYKVIAQLSVTADVGETPDQLIQSLKQKGAALGADYVLVISVSDKTFITAQNLDNDNPYLVTQSNFYSTAGTPNYVTAGSDMREVLTAQALKITSGSNVPNKAAPSKLWQMNQ